MRLYRTIAAAVMLSVSFSSYSKNDEKVSHTMRDTLRGSVITASARMESLLGNRAVPITKVYSKRLEREHAVTYKDLSGTVPNLFVPDYGSKMTSSIYVRGLGARIDNPVMGMYVDGIGMFNKNGFDTELFDIRSVEVLRGPQGTMFGRNTIGGVINISTLSPLDCQGTRASVGYGNGNTLNAKVAHYARLSPDAGIAAAGYYRHTDGFFRNEYDRSEIPASLGAWADKSLCDWSDEAGARLRAVVRRHGNLTIDNTLSAGWARQGGFPYAKDGQAIAYNDICGYGRLTISEGFNLRYLTGKHIISGTTSYQYLNDRMDMDQDYMPVSYFTLTQMQQEHTIAQEISIRPRETRDRLWTHLSGASLFHKYNAMSAPVLFKQDGISELILANANSGISQQYPGYELKFRQDEFTVFSDFATNTTGAAAYHTSFFSLGNWKFEAGIRLDFEFSSFSYASSATVDYLFTKTMTQYRNLVSHLKGNERRVYFEVLPRISASYEADNWSVYMSASKGYKAGGFNTQLFSDILQGQMMTDLMDDLGVYFDDTTFGDYSVSEVITYRPEKCWNFETGSSADFIWGACAASIQGTAFLIETYDQQLTVFPKKGTGRMMTNAGRSYSAGVELSGNIRYGGFSTDISYGFTDARFIRYDNGKENFAGKRIPYVPSNTVYASATYAMRINSGYFYGIDFNINAKGFGKIYWDEANEHIQNFYILAGASAKFIFADFSIELWGKNLTGTRYDTFYFVSMGNTFLQKGKPMQYGITLNIEI